MAHLANTMCLKISFYWILETSRRRVIHITLLTCTAALAIGSEVVQALLPNGRDFDPFDILANVVGSTLALLLCSWYHKRMLERRRANKHYDIVAGEDDEEGGVPGEGERDVELGEGVGLRDQETGSVPSEANGQASAGAKTTNVTEELDNWDENDEDWEEEGAEAAKVTAGVSQDAEPTKKRTD